MARSKSGLDVDLHINVMQSIIKSARDETRFRGLRFCETHKVAFAINEHRFFASRIAYEFFSSQRQTGERIYSFDKKDPHKIICEGQDQRPIDILRFIVKSPTTQATLRIPPWFSLLQGKSKVIAQDNFGSFTIDTRWETPIVVYGRPLAVDNPAGIVSLNPCYVAEFADFKEVVCAFTEPRQPVMFFAGETWKESSWFAVVMPVYESNSKALLLDVTKPKLKPSNKGVKLEKQKHETTSAPI